MVVLHVAGGEQDACIAQPHVRAEFGPQDLLWPLRQIRVRLEGREERQVPHAVSGVSPAPDQLKNRPNLLLGKLVHQVMQFLTHRAHATSI